MRAFFLAALVWLAAIVPAYDATIDRLVTTGTKSGGITCPTCGSRIWVVQKADNSGGTPLTTQTTTLGSAPIQNHMLVAFMEYTSTSAAVGATGWTVLAQPASQASNYSWAAAWHLVGASESATQNPFTTPTCECNVVIYELGGVATNFTSSQEDLRSTSTTTSTLPTLAYTTLNNNDLSLFFGGGETTGFTTSGSNCGTGTTYTAAGSARSFSYSIVGPGILSGNAVNCAVTNTFNQYPMGAFLLTLHP